MKQRIILALLIVIAGFTSCSDDEDIMQAPVISGIEDAYTILEDAELELNPTIENDNNATYIWQLDGKEVASTLNYVFVQSNPGDYQLVLKVGNEGGVDEKEATITVIEKGLAPVITGIKDEYIIETDSVLSITPIITSEKESIYTWFIGDEEMDSSLEKTFTFLKPGAYEITFQAINQGGTTKKLFSIVVEPKAITIDAVAHNLLSLETPNYLKDNDDIKWEVVETPSPLYRLSQMTDEEAPIFVAAKEGTYLLQVSSGDIKGEVTVIVANPTEEPSAYIANVYDYLPAPGQFVNKDPEYKEGDTHEDMVAKAAEHIVGKETKFITLGGWGGYVTFGFDHTIVNVEGKQDFRIEGNAFENSSEPGIVMVSFDANGNGEPDDEWYEINGSANFTAENEEWYQSALEAGNDVNTYRDFEMTYYKPTEESSTTDYLRWTNNKGEEGFKAKRNAYPAWINDDKITFSGVRLAQSGVDASGRGSFFTLKSYKYGYVDNHSKTDDRSTFDIDWAIDKDGNKVNLPGIDFVKVYTGVNQENGWLGENSTEVDRGSDLHLLGTSIDSINE